MEVKVNREIRNYTEAIYFGLSLRQFIFALLGCGASALVYFIFRNIFSIETLSWICILSAFPFIAIGFIKYNGMTCEEFIKAYITSEFLIPKKLFFNPNNLYYKLISDKNYRKQNNDS